MNHWPQPGTTHPFIGLMQTRLTQAGFPMEITETLDPATTDTLRRFQQWAQRPITGTIDGPTMIALWKTTKAPIPRKEANPDVEAP